MAGATLEAIEIDPYRNALKLIMAGHCKLNPTGVTNPVEAVLDVGAQGRLIGVEIPDSYIAVMDEEPGSESVTRSVTTMLVAERDPDDGGIRVITVPRRGAGYEISYPSGNQ